MRSTTIKPTGFGSERYGVCEVCKKHCDSVYILTRYEKGTDENGLPFTFHKGNVFGHRECLEQ